MTKNTYSLKSENLIPADILELALDHDGVPTWYLSTRDGWDEAGNTDSSCRELMLCPGDFPTGCQLKLYVPDKDVELELIEGNEE